ncbi:hypothetical protein ACFVSW_20260 [Neobacillus sp. NPDC058068]|uniref:hypothetical protein n=1 Tax=Neobacillus sp. NPDC058068 TaxID=3346325 RepID=UPI0036DC9C40
MNNLFTVKVWDKDLICEMCSNDKWDKNILKIEVERPENGGEYREEERYKFECPNCGNCKLFGIVSTFNESKKGEEINLKTTPVSHEF